jgi:hypothetical protein
MNLSREIEDRESIDYSSFFKLINPIVSRNSTLIVSFISQLSASSSNLLEIKSFFQQWNTVYVNFYYPLFLLIKKDTFDSSIVKILCDTLIKDYVEKNMEFSAFRFL